ncbi:MAG: fluoride efflux transporter CrcB [Alphaproteobacteria bacterium]|nr:fluoride efflux transporter CrcB [Alphaproteobacteria bacterium]
MRELLFVACGGALGATLRYLIALAATALLGPGFPVGTLLVNIVGGFILGVLVQLGADAPLSPALKLTMGTGFCGALTTFSTFSTETLKLAHVGATGLALGNVALNLALGIGGAALGMWLVR